jgi:hypothetical protein
MKAAKRTIKAAEREIAKADRLLNEVTAEKAPVTLAAYQEAAVNRCTEQIDFGDVIESLSHQGILFDDLVKAELARRNWSDDGSSAVGINELCATQDLAFAIGVAVGRRLR